MQGMLDEALAASGAGSQRVWYQPVTWLRGLRQGDESKVCPHYVAPLDSCLTGTMRTNTRTDLALAEGVRGSVLSARDQHSWRTRHFCAQHPPGHCIFRIAEESA